MIYLEQGPVRIRSMQEGDPQTIVREQLAEGWHPNPETYARYLREDRAGLRQFLAAEWEGELAGYASLLPCAKHGPFAGKPVPHVSDLHVFSRFQRRGIGGLVMDVAERLAFKEGDAVTLGVGLHSGYGAAQRIYALRGYIPDGSGVWYRDALLAEGAPCRNDDELVLYLYKKKREG